MSKAVIVGILIILVITISLAIYSSNPKEIRVRVTTTTSLYATGLLEYLADEFRKEHSNTFFDFIPVGSGEALRRAENGDACMVFVHAPSLEKWYIEKGVINSRKIFAYNYFIIVGPIEDPADIRDSKSVINAFKKIYEAGEEGKAKFVSRGDYSGTHIKELSVWSQADLDPHGRPWYLETGSGMANTLLVANEEKAYALSDVGTYLKLKKEGKLSDLEILYSNDTELINIYSVYIVSLCTGAEKQAAQEFAEFVINGGQELIANYGTEEYGQRLFNPARDNIDWLEEVWEKLSKT
ncbi:MAG: tungsten ABC transporter permease [Thermoprotei archaeon]|nr:MAG: tungsten ABC transporter permease [Thermoprotei archaeon]